MHATAVAAVATCPSQYPCPVDSNTKGIDRYFDTPFRNADEASM